MKLPVQSGIQRCLADFALPGAMGFPGARPWANVGGEGGADHTGALPSHIDHTPSPFGQQRVVPLLPVFSRPGDPWGKKAETRREPARGCRVVVSKTRKEGTGTCSSKQNLHPDRPAMSFWPLRPAARLRPAATTSVNRPSRAVPWAPVPQPSPAAACCRARQSAQGRTWRIANSTPASAAPTDLTRFQRLSGAKIRSTDPAQHMLRRGFCVFTKTKKDSACSRKS